MTSTPAAVLAVAATGLLLIGAAFQVALAAGAPWGAAAYGGRAVRPDGVLPARYRAGSALTVLVLAAAGYLVLRRGGVVGSAAGGWLTAVLWVLTAVFVLNTVGNLAGRHPAERWGMGGLTAALAVLCALLAAGV